MAWTSGHGATQSAILFLSWLPQFSRDSHRHALRRPCDALKGYLDTGTPYPLSHGAGVLPVINSLQQGACSCVATVALCHDRHGRGPDWTMACLLDYG